MLRQSYTAPSSRNSLYYRWMHRGVGVVLSQLDDDGNDHPVLFYSPTTTALQLQPYNYSIICHKGSVNENTDGLSQAFDPKPHKPQPTHVSQEKGGGVSGSHSSLTTHPAMDKLYSVARLVLAPHPAMGRLARLVLVYTHQSQLHSCSLTALIVLCQLRPLLFSPGYV